jgi:putative ABC transport system ATP-binding protein
MIRAEALTLRYFDHGRIIHACEAIDLTIRPGEFVGILGPSGSGKSSLLYLLSGLRAPTSGVVEFQGRRLETLTPAERAAIRLRSFGFVFQQPFLLNYLTAIENACLGQTQPRYDHARRVLERLGIGDLAHRWPHELSGGESQRVCVARALAKDPKVVFADEPTASLDHATGAAVVDLLVSHLGGGALVMATHDPSMLSRATRIIRLADGRIVEPDS